MDYQKTECQSLYHFTLYLKSVRNLSENTIENYFRDISLFLSFVLSVKENPDFENVPKVSLTSCTLAFLETIQREEVYQFLEWMTWVKKAKEKTRARRLSSLKAFYKYLNIQHPNFPDPVASIPAPKIHRSLPVYLQEKEVHSLLENMSGQNYFRNYAIFMIILSAGLRVSEVVSLDLQDFQEDSLLVKGKGGKERRVFLSQSAVNALEDYLQLRMNMTAKAGHETALFLSARQNKRPAVITVQKMVQKTFLLQGMEGRHLSAHKLRHTAATHLLREGVNLRVIQEILGHESLSTTQIYTHVEAEDLRQAAKQSKFGYME